MKLVIVEGEDGGMKVNSHPGNQGWLYTGLQAVTIGAIAGLAFVGSMLLSALR